MDKSYSRNLVRAQINKSWFYLVANIVFALLLFLAVPAAVFLSGETGLSWPWLLAAAGGGVLGAFLLSRLFMLLPVPSRGGELAIVILLFVVLGSLQLYVGSTMRADVADAGSFGTVFGYAEDYVKNGTLPGDYFLHRSGDTGLYLLLCGLLSVLKLFGLASYSVPLVVLNMLAIDTALVLMFFCARRIFGSKKAIFLLIAAIATLPFILYVPLICAETLLLPVPVAVLLMWLKARAYWREGLVKKTVVRFCIISLLVGLAAMVKFTMLVLWVAIALDLLVLLCGKGRLWMLLGGAVITGGLCFGGVVLARNSVCLPAYNYDEAMPYSSWVMMGLSENGDYTEEDMDTILGVEKDDEGDAGKDDDADDTDVPDNNDEPAAPRDMGEVVNQEISRRFSNMGILGLLQHQGKKLGYTFGDGSYGAFREIGLATENTGGLYSFFSAAGNSNTTMALIAFAIKMGMVFWAAMAGVKSLYRKNDALTFLRLAVVGLVVVLSVFTTTPRYLVCYIPLLMLCAMEASPMPVMRRAQQGSDFQEDDEEGPGAEDIDALLPVDPAWAEQARREETDETVESAAGQGWYWPVGQEPPWHAADSEALQEVQEEDGGTWQPDNTAQTEAYTGDSGMAPPQEMMPGMDGYSTGGYETAPPETYGYAAGTEAAYVPEPEVQPVDGYVQMPQTPEPGQPAYTPPPAAGEEQPQDEGTIWDYM